MKTSNHPARMDSKSFRCCLCCHVKTGTLIYGIFVVLFDLICFGALILATIRPDVLITDKRPLFDYGGIYVVETKEGNILETFDHRNVKDPYSKENLCVLFGISLVYLVSAIALIAGVARNIASYLMPMFCLQVFDFCFSCLLVVSCFTYAPNIKQMVYDQGLNRYPVFDLVCDSNYLMVLFVTVVILVLTIKAYILCMIWSCYKYIQLYVTSRGVVREYEYDPDSQMLLPPRYEEAIKKPADSPEPPAYTRE